MRYHSIHNLLLLLLVIFLGTNLGAQNKNQSSENAQEVYIITKGLGSILCNEQYKVDYDDRKEFTLKNNADVRLKFIPKNGFELTKFTINGINRNLSIENNQITLKGISRKTIIVATFEEKENKNDSVKLTIVSGSGGTLYYNGEPINDSKKYTKVKKGTFISLKCSPKKGFELKKISINGILRDVSEDTHSFKIQRNTVVNVTFSISQPSFPSKQVEKKPKLEISVSGPGKATIGGEVNGIVAGDPMAPLTRNKEEFYVKNGSDVTIKLDPVLNIKSFRVAQNIIWKDLTRTVKSSNGMYTVGVMHEHPEKGVTSVVVEFTQRYLVEIICNEYGKYSIFSGNLNKTERTNYYIIKEGGTAKLRFAAKEHCKLLKLNINGVDMTKEAYLLSITENGGPIYEFDLGPVKNNCKIIATFTPKPKLTIACGQHGVADRAQSISDPTGYVHYLDPDYNINSNYSKTFYEPSADRNSAFNGKEWILRITSNEGYKLKKLLVNGVDVTSSVKRIPPYNPRHPLEICYKSLGFIKKDTKVEISFEKSIQQVQQEEWVDLGTGVMWATHNVGAKNASDTGNYYTWKEANNLHAQKGRLPTYEEIQRLSKECHAKYDQENGVNGFRFYHRSNKNISIFIPAAGYYPQYNEPKKLDKKDEQGGIWSSEVTGNRQKVSEAMKEHTMNPIWLIIGDAFSSKGYDRAALVFSIKEDHPQVMNADIGARLSVRLVLDK